MIIKRTSHFLVFLKKNKQYYKIEDFFEAYVAFTDGLIKFDQILLSGDIKAKGLKGTNIFKSFAGAYLSKVKTMQEALKIAEEDPYVIKQVYAPKILIWNLID